MILPGVLKACEIFITLPFLCGEGVLAWTNWPRASNPPVLNHQVAVLPVSSALKATHPQVNVLLLAISMKR